MGDEEIEDDRLRLIFTCCHPALPPEGQVALTLREVCGLTTEEIARAFLVTPATLAQRIVRAEDKDSRSTNSLRSADAARITAATGRGAAGGVSRLQRGLLGCGGSGGNAGRVDWRGDSTGPAAGRTPAGTGSDRAACADAAAGIPSRRENLADRRADFAESQDRSLWNREADRGGRCTAWRGPSSRAASALTHCRRRLRPFIGGGIGGCDRLAGRLSRSTTSWCGFSLRRWCI